MSLQRPSRWQACTVSSQRQKVRKGHVNGAGRHTITNHAKVVRWLHAELKQTLDSSGGAYGGQTATERKRHDATTLATAASGAWCDTLRPAGHSQHLAALHLLFQQTGCPLSPMVCSTTAHLSLTSLPLVVLLLLPLRLPVLLSLVGRDLLLPSASLDLLAGFFSLPDSGTSAVSTFFDLLFFFSSSLGLGICPSQLVAGQRVATFSYTWPDPPQLKYYCVAEKFCQPFRFCQSDQVGQVAD